MGTAASKGRSKNERNFLLQTLEDHESAINCMCLSDDGSVLATGSDDHNIRLWSAKTTPVECLSVLFGHMDYITCILMDENYLISGSADRTIRKWDMTNGQCIFIYSGHTSLINRLVCTGKFNQENFFLRSIRKRKLRIFLSCFFSISSKIHPTYGSHFLFFYSFKWSEQ